MAPARKSRSVNRKYPHVNNEAPSSKHVDSPRKSRPRKRKLSDMLGPQWSKDELERFYKAYRKSGQDWEKVAAAVRSRSAEMVEALYTMNRAYLSLPKGVASAAGLIAMMTDHYSNMGDSDSDQDNNESPGASRKPQKRARGAKGVEGSPVPDVVPSQPASSDEGCLSLLMKRRYASKPWAVGKRTPRVPVSSSTNKDYGENYISPIRRVTKLKSNALDDDVAHEIALALAEASQRGGSSQVSRTPNKKSSSRSPVKNVERMQAESEMTTAKVHGDESGCELSLGSTDAEDCSREKSSLKKKVKRSGKSEVDETMDNHLDDIKEACSGTEEGQKMDFGKGKLDTVAMDSKLGGTPNKGPRKRSKKFIFGEDEDAALDALQALGDLSWRLPEIPADTESSVDLKDKRVSTTSKSKTKGNQLSPGVKVTSSKTMKQEKALPLDVTALPKTKEATHHVSFGLRKRRQKSVATRDVDNAHDFVAEGNRSHDDTHLKLGKLMKPPAHTSFVADNGREPSSVASLTVNEINMPTKVRSRRKKNSLEQHLENDAKSFTIIANVSDVTTPSQEKAFNLTGQIDNCLSWYLFRRWCAAEWFYSAIDYPWFAKQEFAEYLDHVGLGHIPKLTRVEWGVIRSSLGRPRRFSQQFLKEEKEKLNQYRKSVRKHYAELRAGTRDGLPTDLARPLSVGQRVIAVHPRTKEICNGSVLTVDHNRYHVQFDLPELGVEFVADVDCMPLNPLENMPASLVRHSLPSVKSLENGFNSHGSPIERKMETPLPIPSLSLEDGHPHASVTSYHVDNLLQQAKGGLTSSSSPIKVRSCEIVNNQPAANAHPSIDEHFQAKEADIHALSELTRALDKKVKTVSGRVKIVPDFVCLVCGLGPAGWMVPRLLHSILRLNLPEEHTAIFYAIPTAYWMEAVVSELKRMNDEVVENQKDGIISVKDSEPFQKHYASVILQLNEVNEQVSSALLRLRQRNTYQPNAMHMWFKPMGSSGELLSLRSHYDHLVDGVQECGTYVAEIVESSRSKAQNMVGAAMQAMPSVNADDSMQSIEDAIDFVNNRLSVDVVSQPPLRSSHPANSAHGTAISPDQSSSCTEDMGASNHEPDAKPTASSKQTDAQFPSELIAECVATLLMIQRCTERQFPPSDVAQVLDSAVLSLKPSCPQNLPIYAEIQKCMGIIKNQILALVPT